MKNHTPNNSNKNGLRHNQEYEQFITWLALPQSLRDPKTQTHLAQKLGVGPDTLSEWKQRDNFWDKVNKKMKLWAKEKNSDVIGILYDKIIKTGGAPEIRIWLEWQKEIDNTSNESKELQDLRQSFKKLFNFQREISGYKRKDFKNTFKQK